MFRMIRVTCAALAVGIATIPGAQAAERRNIVIFVADGLRHSSVNPTDAPVMTALRAQGVTFTNSHSLFPTFTTPNASAIATSHLLGDTGDFSNTIYVGYANHATGSVTPFIENDAVLTDIDEHFPGANFLDSTTLLAAARAAGWHTAAVGKLGPTLIQDASQAAVPLPASVVIDDTTGKPGGMKLADDIAARMTAAGLPLVAPGRGANGNSGNNTTPGTTAANVEQQAYFVDAVTKVILPSFKAADAPFALVYWSRDPDGSQHNQGDSLNTLTPGINGPTSRASIANADANFGRVIEWLRANGELERTDIFVTSDHGFSTISKHELSADGQQVASGYAASLTYPGVNKGWLPPGFVAIDLAHALDLPLFDPDKPVEGSFDKAAGTIAYTPLDPAMGQRPFAGNGVIGGSGRVTAGQMDARVVVAANGGSDLIYVPDGDPAMAKRIVAFLLAQDYTSGVFVDEAKFGKIPGALSLSDIGLQGSALTPVPAIVLNFRSFDLGCPNPLACTVEVADTGLQEGQGMHGSFSRADTYNNMIAVGPDFKTAFEDAAPVSNADIAVTLAKAAGLDLLGEARGKLVGRVIAEALAGGPAAPAAKVETVQADPGEGGMRTALRVQTLAQEGRTWRYLVAGGFRGRTVP